MTKTLRSYILTSVRLGGAFTIMQGLCSVFETSFGVDFGRVNLGIWVFGIGSLCRIVWRGFDGFIGKADFWIDHDDYHRRF